jgi:lipoate-protein ligase A
MSGLGTAGATDDQYVMGVTSPLRWVLLVDQAADGPWNMAVDQALLQSAEERGVATLRLYSWQPATLSFGRNEPAQRRYDRAEIERLAMPTVRRPTGGRAVWHDDEVTYAVAAPAAGFGSLREAYREIHALLAEALVSLGAPVLLAAERPAVGVGAGACFASAAGGEVVAAGGGKVVGSAQVRGEGAFLQHGSIILGGAQERVAHVTLGAADPPNVVGLTSLLPAGRATREAVVQAVAQAAARRWQVPSEPAALPEETRRAAEALLPRYRNPGWTWRR